MIVDSGRQVHSVPTLQYHLIEEDEMAQATTVGKDQRLYAVRALACPHHWHLWRHGVRCPLYQPFFIGLILSLGGWRLARQ